VQKGTIQLIGNCWLLRYRQPVLVDGRVVMKARAKKLATYCREYRTEESVRPKADLILAPINAKTARPESDQRVADFIAYVYLEHCQQNLKLSTVKGYKDMWRLVQPHLDGLRLRDTRTSDIDRLMRAVASQKQRAHTTHRNLKSFLSGAFRFAKRNDLITDNPVRDSVVPKGKPAGETHAYALEEIVAFLAALDEPARTAVIVTAFSGLRVSEVKGLRWEDLTDDAIAVRRSVWCGHVSDTKTLRSRAPVPMVPLVKRALEEHSKRQPLGNGWIFEGATGSPLRLENLVRRAIKPALTKAGLQWHGWHAFRRGVGTNLNMLGFDDKTIQTILRHANVATTQSFYIKPVAKEAVAAMRKLERAFTKALNRRKK
jgi:integrase